MTHTVIRLWVHDIEKNWQHKSHKSEYDNNLVFWWFVGRVCPQSPSPRYEYIQCIGPYHTQWCCSTPTEFWDPWCSTRDGVDYLGYDSSCLLNLCPDTWERKQRWYGEERKELRGIDVSHNNWWGLLLSGISVISLSICHGRVLVLSMRKVSRRLLALRLTFWAGSCVCEASLSPIAGTPCRSLYGPFCPGNPPHYTTYRLLSTKKQHLSKSFL